MFFNKEEIENKCPYISATVVDCIPSTSTHLKCCAEEGAGEFSVLFAKEQTAGRGRITKSFISPKGGLYFSIVLRPIMPPSDIVFITSAAAVAVARAIEAVAQKSPKIKWVNDIYIDDKKVCGILTEGKLNPTTKQFDYIILGIGLNVFTPKNSFDEQTQKIADSLFKTKQRADTYLLLAQHILDNFNRYYKNLQNKEYMDYYISNSYLTGKTVTFLKDNETHTARALRIDENANLVVEENGREIRLFHSEVSIKL